MELNLGLWKARFREHLEVRHYSEVTVKGYLHELGRFLEVLTGWGMESVTELKKEHVEAYRAHLFYSRYRGRSISQQTQQCRLAAVKAFTRFLFRADYLLLDPGALVESPRKALTLPRTVLSEGEVLSLLEVPDLEHPHGIRDRAVLEVFYGTGIRNTELRNLTLDHFDRQARLLRIELGKGKKSRVVPLGDEAQGWVEEYLERVRPALVPEAELPWLFLSNRGRQFHLRTLCCRVSLLGRQAGLSKKVTPHVLRHSCATHMLKRGAGIRHLQQLLGHSTPTTTQVYTRVEVSDLRRVLERCHPREKRPGR